MPTSLIIGAGMAGLTAARELTRRGWQVTVLDKGRGVGGRLATRRLDQARADHGAPYFAAETPAFSRFVGEQINRGIITEWPSVVGPAGEASAPRYAGVGGMNALPKALADGLLVKTDERVVQIRPSASGWQAQTEGGNTYRAESLLVTIPAPQALALLADSGVDLIPADQAALTAIRYQPCLAVLVSLNQPSRIPAPGLIRYPTGAVARLIDNQQKGISPEQPSVTLHASFAFSQTHLDGDLNAAGQPLVESVAEWVPANAVSTVQVHRWRYSFADERHPVPFLAVRGTFPLLFGGDGFGTGNVEGAFTSGRRMAEFLTDSGR